MVDLITGNICDGSNMKTLKINKSEICLDNQVEINKSFLDSNFNVVNQVYHQKQDNDKMFTSLDNNKELYKIIGVYYQNLVYVANEVLIYENENSDEIQIQLKNDMNDNYRNCLYSQLLNGIHPCLDSFFENDRDSVRKIMQNTKPLDQELILATQNALTNLRLYDELDKFDISQFTQRRYLLTDKEYVNYFSYSDELFFDILLIKTNRIKSMLSNSIFEEISRIAEKRTVVFIYDKNEYKDRKSVV